MVWNINSNIRCLLALRDELGDIYGSEELCVLMYSLIKREKPSLVVELGTGYGVTSAWMAAALKENGNGCVFTYDNGSCFDSDPRLFNLDEPLYQVARVAEDGTYTEFLTSLFSTCDVSDYIKFVKTEIDISETWPLKGINRPKIDMLFSDFNHSPEMILKIIGAYLPFMGRTSSIFIDSASTKLSSRLILEKMIQIFHSRRVPAIMEKWFSNSHVDAISHAVETSSFKLVHLQEAIDRDQNSTAWIQVYPADVFPICVRSWL